MATAAPETVGVRTPVLSKDAQQSIVNYLTSILANHKARVELRNKMEAIDVAYARYKGDRSLDASGKDLVANVECDVFSKDNISAPIVVSQVDTFVAYLSEVFLSGFPLFPVVSTPRNRKYAEQLETLIDDHALIGGYPRQLLMFLRNAVKYNLGAVETDWQAVDQMSVASDFTNTTGQKINRTAKFFTKLKNIDMYNFVFDPDVLPGDLSESGDYAGYIEMESAIKLKRRLNKYNKFHKAYNINGAMKSGQVTPVANGTYYTQPPQISNYIDAGTQGQSVINWDAYAAGANSKRTWAPPGVAGHEICTMYCRIMPGDHGISAPQPNTPQIWKFVLVNSSVLVFAERVITAYDYLPILVGQPMEDGLRYQTQSIAESEIPFQEAASTLFNIRFAAARRAVSDRALYRADMISPSDVNSKNPAPKIPVRLSSLENVGLESAYRQIPFDMRGTETTIGDAQTIVEFSKMLHGQNNPRQGQFQRGNKSVQEWTDTMSGSENRMRLPALALEYQFFSPLKSILALNIFQYAEEATVVSQKSGDVITINIEELRRQTLSFRIADGYSPKSKLASTEMLGQGLQLLMSSEVLQQAYGDMLPDMFAHMMQLGGVRGLEEYSPKYRQQQEQQAAQGGSPATIPQQGLDAQNLGGAPANPMAIMASMMGQGMPAGAPGLPATPENSPSGLPMVPPT